MGWRKYKVEHWNMYAYFDAADEAGQIVRTWEARALKGRTTLSTSDPVAIFSLPASACYGRLRLHNDVEEDFWNPGDELAHYASHIRNEKEWEQYRASATQ